jgi:hypothetical protein
LALLLLLLHVALCQPWARRKILGVHQPLRVTGELQEVTDAANLSLSRNLMTMLNPVVCDAVRRYWMAIEFEQQVQRPIQRPLHN